MLSRREFRPGRKPGESRAPVKQVRVRRGEPIPPEVHIEPTPLLLNWRDLLRASTLSGLPLQFAQSAEILDLTDDHVLLRPQVRALLGSECRAQIEQALTALKGHPFKVDIDDGEMRQGAPCVLLLDQAEKRAARLAMIDAFKSDPIVQECVRVLCAEIDETSIRPLTENEVREIVIYERKHPGSARSGPKNAKKR